jgi:hypothetical protein
MAQNIIQGPEQTDRPEILFGAVLGGRSYDMRLIWRPCQSYWDLELYSDSGETLLAGILVQANVDMLQPYSDLRMPPGKLICHDTTNKQQMPGRTDWRERHRLVYVDPEAVEEESPIKVTRLVLPD